MYQEPADDMTVVVQPSDFKQEHFKQEPMPVPMEFKQEAMEFKPDMSSFKPDMPSLKSDIPSFKSDMPTYKSDISSFKSDMSSYEDKTNMARRRGRPRKDGMACNQRLDKCWGAEETHKLIEYWGKQEVLYNQKHKSYHDKEARNRAIKEIQVCLAAEGVHATEQQIFEKLISLRSYYCGQLSKIENSKLNGDPEIFESNWKYFKALDFLSENVIPRKNELLYKRRRTEPVDIKYFPSPHMIPPYHLERPSAFERTSMATLVNVNKPIPGMPTDMSEQRPNFAAVTIHPPIVASPRPVFSPEHVHHQVLERKQIYAPPVVIAKPMIPSPPSTNNTNSSNSAASKLIEAKSSDGMFIEMITSMLKEIPEGEEKDMLKIQIQQNILKTKYATKIAPQTPPTQQTQSILPKPHTLQNHNDYSPPPQSNHNDFAANVSRPTTQSSQSFQNFHHTRTDSPSNHEKSNDSHSNSPKHNGTYSNGVHHQENSINRSEYPESYQNGDYHPTSSNDYHSSYITVVNPAPE